MHLQLPPLTRGSYLPDPMIKIHVSEGDGCKTFNVHKTLLTSRSRFFANALTDGTSWREAEDGAVRLPEDDPSIFTLYLEILYHNRIPVRESEAKADQAECQKDIKALQQAAFDSTLNQYETLGKLYVLCDMLQDDRASNLVISAFVEISSTLNPYTKKNHHPGRDPVGIVYRNTPASDPLRKYLTELYVFHAEEHWFSTMSANDYPAEFLFDVMAGMARARSKPSAASRLRDASNYHRKIEGEEDNAGKDTLSNSA